MRDWRAGDHVLLREIFRNRIWTVRPLTVAHATDELIALYLAPGTVFKVPAFTHHRELLRRLRDGWSLTDYEWTRGRCLYLLMPHVAHAIHLRCLAPDWRVGGWYVNLQEPIRATAVGDDTMEQILDVVIEPDLSWRWKDEDELDEAIGLGVLTPLQAESVRGEGVRVIRRLEARKPPFCD